MNDTLAAFLADAEARCKEALTWNLYPCNPAQEAFFGYAKRDLPAALSLLRAFAAVVEEARRVAPRAHRDVPLFTPAHEHVDNLIAAIAAADAAVAEMGTKEGP